MSELLEGLSSRDLLILAGQLKAELEVKQLRGADGSAAGRSRAANGPNAPGRSRQRLGYHKARDTCRGRSPKVPDTPESWFEGSPDMAAAGAVRPLDAFLWGAGHATLAGIGRRLKTVQWRLSFCILRPMEPVPGTEPVSSRRIPGTRNKATGKGRTGFSNVPYGAFRSRAQATGPGLSGATHRLR